MTRRTARRPDSYWPKTAVDPRSLVPRPCRFDPDIFTSSDRHDIARAKAICSGCPQAQTCLAHGLELDEVVDVVASFRKTRSTIGIGHLGVYGGLTELERRRLRRAGQTGRKTA
jgi:hypothetical protein